MVRVCVCVCVKREEVNGFFYGSGKTFCRNCVKALLSLVVAYVADMEENGCLGPAACSCGQ